jgi:hypothetical protein
MYNQFQPALGLRGGLWPVLFMCNQLERPLCPSSGDINRLMMMIYTLTLVLYNERIKWNIGPMSKDQKGLSGITKTMFYVLKSRLKLHLFKIVISFLFHTTEASDVS